MNAYKVDRGVVGGYISYWDDYFGPIKAPNWVYKKNTRKHPKALQSTLKQFKQIKQYPQIKCMSYIKKAAQMLKLVLIVPVNCTNHLIGTLLKFVFYCVLVDS